MLKYFLYGAVTIVVIGGLGWYAATRPNLPPTSLEGHIEASPPAHILNQPMIEAIQRHMLEHADGRGQPGIIIQYNCQDYTCEPNLIQKLTELVRQYPDHVYLAPNNYDGKIILTREGQLKALGQFDEKSIREFIES